MLNRALCMFQNNNTANSIAMSMDERRFAVWSEAIRRNRARAHLFLQRAVACPDADERERTMQDSDTALAFEARQQDAPVLRVAAQTY